MSGLRLTAAQRRRLEQQLRTTREAGPYRRTLAILEAADGRPISEVARSLRTSRRSVHYWIASYEHARDPTSLADHRGGNHPSLGTEELRAALHASLEQRPDHFGHQAVEWTVPLLREHLARCAGQRPSATSIRRQLHDLGYVWKRPRYVRDPDPERDTRTANPSRPPAVAIPVGQALRGYETDLRLFPPLRSAWGLPGQSLEVSISGFNVRRVVLGTINIDTGHRLFLVRKRPKGEDFRAFLPVIRSHYRGWHVALLLDEDPSHTAARSQELAAEWGIRLTWMPKRCPELNGMDHLWGHGKDHVCANRQYAGIDEEVDRFVGFLGGLSNREALRQAGILSEDFWLKV